MPARATKFKVIAAVAAILLAVVLIVQNVEQVDTRVLFWKVPMPRAVLLAVTAAVGFVGGLIVASFGGRKK